MASAVNYLLVDLEENETCFISIFSMHVREITIVVYGSKKVLLLLLLSFFGFSEPLEKSPFTEIKKY